MIRRSDARVIRDHGSGIPAPAHNVAMQTFSLLRCILGWRFIVLAHHVPVPEALDAG
jgi:hypothetical protein